LIRFRKRKSGIPELETEKLQETFRNFSKQVAMAPPKAKKNKRPGAATSEEPADSQESQRTKGPVQGVDFTKSRRDGAAPEPRTPGEI